MKKTKMRRSPYGGSKPMPDNLPEVTHRRNINSKKYFSDDDPTMKLIYERGCPKQSELARLHSERDTETAIRTTSKLLRETPYRKWDASLISDAQKYLSPQLVNLIMKEQQEKR